jgi:hypothetical protein
MKPHPDPAFGGTTRAQTSPFGDSAILSEFSKMVSRDIKLIPFSDGTSCGSYEVH